MRVHILVLFLHIASSTLLLGTSIVGEPAVRAAARRTTRPEELRSSIEVGRRMAPISPVAALLVLATGVYLTNVGYAWTLGWVQLSIALWLVNSLVAVVVVKPAVEKVAAEARATSDASIGSHLDGIRWSGAWTWGVDVLATNDAVILCVMVLKPGLTGSLALLLLAHAIVVGGRMALGLSHPRDDEAAVSASRA